MHCTPALVWTCLTDFLEIVSYSRSLGSKELTYKWGFRLFQTQRAVTGISPTWTVSSVFPVMEPQALQIVNSNDNTITLNEEALSYILSKDAIKDRYISIISISGTFRQGKSFLLNFFLRYLRVKYIQQKDVTEWLQAEDGPVKGFSWSPGSKRHTTGIHMWSEVFLTQLPTGEEVAIILLDTQGAFDNESSMSDSAIIFALSTLISSVQIYNLMRNIKHYDLTHLQCFGGYGKLISNTGTTPFQRLIFLVRDWPYAYEKPYGSEGGNKLLKEIFSKKDVPAIQAEIDSVNELFADKSCFLLPHPGQIVDISMTFDGDLEEISEDFKKYVQEFVPSILAPKNLVVKTIHGEKIKAGDLVHYIKEYCKVLKEGPLPEIRTVYQASVEAHFKAAVYRAVKFYKKNMDLDVDASTTYAQRDLDRIHSVNKLKTKEYYEELRKFDDPELNDKCLLELVETLNEEFSRYVETNKEKIAAELEEKRRRERAELLEKRRRERAELEKKRRQEHADSLNRRVNRQQAGSSQGTSTLDAGDVLKTAGTAVAVVGGIAALAFGASHLFSSRKNNN